MKSISYSSLGVYPSYLLCLSPATRPPSSQQQKYLPFALPCPTWATLPPFPTPCINAFMAMIRFWLCAVYKDFIFKKAFHKSGEQMIQNNYPMNYDSGTWAVWNGKLFGLVSNGDWMDVSCDGHWIGVSCELNPKRSIKLVLYSVCFI